MNGQPVYKLALKNEKRNSYQRISSFVIIANIFIFIYFLIFPADENMMIAAAATLICIFIYYLAKYFFYRPRLFNEGSILNVYTLLFLGYLGLGFYIPAIIIVILSILLSIATRQFSISVYNDGIRYNALPAKEYKWKEINHIILKDGLLTIEFANNKIFQEMTDETDAGVDENEFNEFCRQHMSK